jgi:DNA-binding protein Fis
MKRYEVFWDIDEPVELVPLDEIHRRHVLAVLAHCHNNQTDAAKILGLDRKTVSRMLRRWGLKTRHR